MDKGRCNLEETMEIRVKLYASLAEYLPVGAIRNEIAMLVPTAATPTQIIHRLGVPETMCHMVLVNGVYITPEVRSVSELEEGDHLAVWPPVAGGCN